MTHADVRLHDQVQRLRLILPVISVWDIAVRTQNADLDDDIASALHRNVSDPLEVEIVKLAAPLEAPDTWGAREDHLYSSPARSHWMEPSPAWIASKNSTRTVRR